MIKNKVQKICDSFQAKKYQLPNNTSEYKALEKELDSEQEQTLSTIRLTQASIEQKLIQFQAVKFPSLNCSFVTFAVLFLQKQITLFETLNLFQITQTTFTCTLYVPQSSSELLLSTIQKYKNANPNSPSPHRYPLEIHDTPPTYFNTNSFTAPFQ